MIQETNERSIFHINNPEQDSQSEENCKSEILNKKNKQKENFNIQFDHGYTHRKSRNIKIEKEELSSIFSELICLVNTKVHVIETEGQKSQTIPNNFLSFKSKKSLKPKKDETERQNIPDQIIEIPNPMKEEIKPKIIPHFEIEKETILFNYNQIMQYKIYENEFHIEKNKTINKSYYNNFHIFESYSFSLNPLYFQTTH